MIQKQKHLIGTVLGLLSVGLVAYFTSFSMIQANPALAQDNANNTNSQSAGNTLQQAGNQVKAEARQAVGQAKQAMNGGSAQPLTVKDISLDQAQKVVQAALAKAKANDLKSNIAVVDRGGHLKAFARMDGAWLGSIDIAIKKAKTARYFDMPTGKIGKLSQPGKSLYMIEVSNDGLITFPGGVPIKSADGQIIGAVGASGSAVEDDHKVASAGAQALGK